MVIKLGDIGDKTNLSLLTLVSSNSQLDGREEIYSICFYLFLSIVYDESCMIIFLRS